jgi:hypothetical protein
LLQLFPRLEVLSVATDVDKPQYVDQKRSGVSLYQQNLRIALYKPVTVDDLQGLNLQFHGTRNNGCVCFFGVQMATSLTSGRIRVSHVIELAVCAGAGIITHAGEDEIITRGQGMKFKPTSEMRVELLEPVELPVDKQLVHSTLSLVLDLARVAKHATLLLRCGPRGLEILNDTVSCIRTVT